MAGLREILAIVLGIALGAFLIAYPGVFIRIQTLGRFPHDRRGRYGETDTNNGWIRIVQGLGVLCLLAAGYVTFQLV